jgi:hypothetical protein
VLLVALLDYIVGRLLQMIPVIIGVSLIAFVSIHFVPGDPVEIMMHGRATPEALAAAHAKLGLDQPVLVQYWHFIVNAAQGDLGTSIIQNANVSKIVGERMLPTIYLLVTSAFLAVVIAVPLSIVAARRADQAADHVIRLAGIVGFAMPPFWIGILLILLFGITSTGFRFRIAGSSTASSSFLVDHRHLPGADPRAIPAHRDADVMAAGISRWRRLRGRRILVKHAFATPSSPSHDPRSIRVAVERRGGGRIPASRPRLLLYASAAATIRIQGLSLVCGAGDRSQPVGRSQLR